MTGDRNALFFFFYRLTHALAHVPKGSEDSEKSISRNSSGTKNLANTFFCYQRAYRKTTQRARTSFTPDREDEKREAYRAERNRRFIQNSPMTVSSVFARSYPVVTNVRSYVWSR